MIDNNKSTQQRRERPVMFIFQYLDKEGNPTPIDKNQIVVLAATRDDSKALDVMECAEFATYKKVVVT